MTRWEIEEIETEYKNCKRLLEKNPYVYSINMIEVLIDGKKSRSLTDFNNDRDKVILNSFKRMVKKAIKDGEITMDFLLNGDATEVEKFLAYKSVKIPGNWEYNQNVFSKFEKFNSYRDLKYYRSLIKEFKNDKWANFVAVNNFEKLNLGF